MKVLGATYERTFNLGDFNSEKIGLSAELQKGEEAVEVIAELKKLVMQAHGEEASTESSEEESEQEEESTSTKKSKKKAKKASKTKGKKNGKSNSDSNDDDEDGADESEEDESDDGESSDDDEASDDEADDDGDSESDDDESESEDDEDEKPKGKKSKGGKKGSDKKAKSKKGGKRNKPQTYDRENENHKEIFSKVLRSVDPDWKKTDKGLARGKKASQEMEGHDFLDAEGEVLESFTEGVEEWMKAKKKK